MSTAKLFNHGRSQAVRLPKDFRMPGDEVRVRRVGTRVILEPLDEGAVPWALIDSLGSPILENGRGQPLEADDREELD